jgi:hypothetical protein
MKIGPVEHELFHTDRPVDGRTDLTILIVAFKNFAKLAKDACIRAWSGIWTHDPSVRAVNSIRLRRRFLILYQKMDAAGSPEMLATIRVPSFPTTLLPILVAV